MTSTRFITLFGGISSLICGVLLFLAHLLNYFGKTAYGTVYGSTLIYIAHILLVFVFIGIYHVLSNRTDLLFIFGMILSTLGTIVISSIVFVEIAGSVNVNIQPVFDSELPNTIRTIGSLMFVLGMLLFGTSIIRSKMLPAFGGILLILGTVIFALASMAGDTEAIITVIGAFLTGVGFVWISFPILFHKRNNQNASSILNQTH
jgi:hypothetical protein